MGAQLSSEALGAFGLGIEASMDLIKSWDGTVVAVWQSGSGAPLLLVHGATADHSTTWRFVQPYFETKFAVYVIDRRGRGSSGDSSRYELRNEAEDIASVIQAIGEPTNVVGHSYGALCCLEAALLTTGIKRLILYEGVPLKGDNTYPAGIIDRLEELVAADKLEEALVAMYREIVEMSPAELEVMKADATAWTTRLRNVRSMPREARVEQSYTFTPQRFTDMRVPTLLLVGGESPPRELENARGVATGLREASVAILPGQQHVAMYTAPDLFIRAVEQFIIL
jgi:pimeloyl-ACP methyl ester carboxylesterase